MYLSPQHKLLRSTCNLRTLLCIVVRINCQNGEQWITLLNIYSMPDSDFGSIPNMYSYFSHSLKVQALPSQLTSINHITVAKYWGIPALYCISVFWYFTQKKSVNRALVNFKLSKLFLVLVLPHEKLQCDISLWQWPSRRPKWFWFFLSNCYKQLLLKENMLFLVIKQWGLTWLDDICTQMIQSLKKQTKKTAV